MEAREQVPGTGETVAATQAGQATVDQAKVQELIREIRAGQNLTMGIVGGAVAAVVGAAVWAAVTVATGVQIGWMAVGVGFLVGGAIRLLGKGIDKPFGYAGAALSLFGCLLGNLLSIYAILAQQEELSFFFVLTHANLSAIPELFRVTFHPMDLLFYGIAIYEGYRFSFRRLTQADLARISSRPAQS
ncbi:MAG: hypothetical protein JW993_05380 [Sedimentisphaerales bacterium]|nr:hypothetical protein [Sedimentisphaerales bacterium]